MVIIYINKKINQYTDVSLFIIVSSFYVANSMVLFFFNCIVIRIDEMIEQLIEFRRGRANHTDPKSFTLEIMNKIMLYDIERYNVIYHKVPISFI